MIEAQTCGDGICALHAIFGRPQHHKGPLIANNVRHMLVEKLDMSLDMFLNTHPHISLNLLMQIFKVLWKDLGFEVATNKNNNGNMEQCSGESFILWKSLPIESEKRCAAHKNLKKRGAAVPRRRRLQ